jgi:hypothetical protein
MFEIYAASASTCPDIIALIDDPDVIPRGDERDDLPFLQAGYDEIDPDELDRVLAYANIAGTNGPVGVPRLSAPVSHGTEWVLFPIVALREHLSTVRENETISSTAADFASAVDAVAQYCQRNDLLMVFRW